MRPEFDRQFDSLLREHARRVGSAPPDGDARAPARDGLSRGREAAAAHLDADELSAFAENALPASARARHTAHLVGCGDCRRLVSQITLASGVAEEIERREPSHAVGLSSANAIASPSPTWGERFAALFRPGAWRYALPLAALLVVSAAVLVLTSGRRRGEVGQLASSKDNARTGQTPELNHGADQRQRAEATSAASQNTATDGSAAGENAGKPAARLADSRTSDDINQTASPAPGGSIGGAQVTPAEAAKRASAEATAPPPATFAAEPVPAQTPSPAPPQQTRELAAAASQPAPARPEADKAAESKEKDRFDERGNASLARKQRGHGPMRNETQQQSNARNRQAEEAQVADSAPKSDNLKKTESNSAGGGIRAAAPPAARGESRKVKSGAGRGDDAEGGVETRSVGGRRFRRQSDAWVDTSYKTSQATVHVRRGSEQYRSLVGDEPGIARIANALGGEVVVVWKGRAYRVKP